MQTEPRWSKYVAWTIIVGGLVLAGAILFGGLLTGCRPTSRDLPSLRSR